MYQFSSQRGRKSGNQESGIRNQESGIRNQEIRKSEIRNYAMPKASLSQKDPPRESIGPSGWGRHPFGRESVVSNNQ